MVRCLKALRSMASVVVHATLLIKGKLTMHSPISCTVGILRLGLLAVCIGACLWVVLAVAGCSSGGNSTAMEQSGPADSLGADPQVHEILVNSCFDCHSDSSSGSWTAKIAPSYLFGADKGRAALNFSNWAAEDAKQRATTASLIAAVVDSGSMPPGDYVFFHPSARLDNEQKKLVLQWTSQQKLLRLINPRDGRFGRNQEFPEQERPYRLQK